MKALQRLCPLAGLKACVCLAFLLAGCESRSISDSGYRHHGYYGYYGEGGPKTGYRGELNEFNVLGVERGGQITEEQIVKSLDSAARIKLRKGSSILLIQSGALQPDPPMRRALETHFNVLPFSGQPPRTNSESYAKSLRLAAAQAGCETILCYWGTLESARRDLDTKTISWVPIVGWMVPDEKQQMRIQLKMAVIEVRTGHWTMFAPESFERHAMSDMLSRESSDQGQVEKLKKLAYEAVAEDLTKIYAN
jgi:hypothetical protein